MGAERDPKPFSNFTVLGEPIRIVVDRGVCDMYAYFDQTPEEEEAGEPLQPLATVVTQPDIRIVNNADNGSYYHEDIISVSGVFNGEYVYDKSIRLDRPLVPMRTAMAQRRAAKRIATFYK